MPRHLTDAYRRACPTMRGRSDIYVGFFEVGMRILKPDGRLGFICADRWMHNDYGSALRDRITADYAIESIVSMHDVDAFEDEVSAYPAVVVIRNGTQEAVRVVNATAGFEAEASRAVTRWIDAPDPNLMLENAEGTRIDKWFTGTDLWPSGNNARKQLVADLEHRFLAARRIRGQGRGLASAWQRDVTTCTSSQTPIQSNENACFHSSLHAIPLPAQSTGQVSTWSTLGAKTVLSTSLLIPSSRPTWRNMRNGCETATSPSADPSCGIARSIESTRC